MIETGSDESKATIEQLKRTLPRDMQRLVVTSKLEGDFTYLQMEIVTYADLWKRAQAVVDFIERTWRTFEPFQVKLEATVWSRWKSRYSKPRIFGLMQGRKKWTETRQLLLQGDVANIMMIDWESHHSHQLRLDSDVYLEVHFGSSWEPARGHYMRLDPIFDPREAKMLKLCLSTRVWDGRISAETQEQIVSLACDLFQVVDGACGYVSLGKDYAGLYQLTPYERRLGMDRPNTMRLWRDVRGAFWGNLLSARHVQALGGIQLVKQQAPCYKVTAPANEGTGTTDSVPLYLQVTQMMEVATQEDYERLEAFLSPILISSRDQLGIVVLDQALVASLGEANDLKHSLADSVRRAVVLPRGALLAEYDNLPDSWPMVNNALKRMGCDDARGYRDIPQLRSMWWPDDAGVATLAHLIPPRPKSGPLLPAILVQPCIPSDALEFQVSFANPPTSSVIRQMKELVREWSTLRYEIGHETPMISECSIPKRRRDLLVWQADLAPVGQDAYIQLVLMLDEFSKTTARLAEVHVGAWAK
jgi:hypothetical protein